MGKYEEKISDQSLWMTATHLARTLPFFVSEAGHFLAACDYQTKRDTHDSFLLIYTVSGQGIVQTGEHVMMLPGGSAVVIDCHIPHEYHSVSETWEFLWIHFHGSGIQPLFEIAYPDNAIHAIPIEHAADFEKKVSSLVWQVRENNIAAYLRLSLKIHEIFGDLCVSSLTNSSGKSRQNGAEDVRAAVEYIEQNYFRPITVEDMIQNIPVSKYHFIRHFGRVMGITPYSYLTNYRINISKTLLRSTDKTVAEIAEACGFLDTSNFITHFKKHTGQKPLQYRRDFS